MIFSSNAKFEKKDETVASASSDPNNFYTKDSDGDGVYDWEEGLWGTNPTNKDSNGDGVSDGEQINAQKEEIRGKNDLAENPVKSDEDLTQTEIFARQLFSTTSLARQSGGLSAESLDSFSKAFGRSISDTKVADIYNFTSVKLTNMSAKEYKAELASIFTLYAKAGIHAERSIYDLANGDITAETDIEKLASIYHDISNRLITSNAPYAQAGTHLSLANTTAKLSVALLNIKKFNDDPILATTGLHQYETNIAELEKSFATLQSYFSANGIMN